MNSKRTDKDFVYINCVFFSIFSLINPNSVLIHYYISHQGKEFYSVKILFFYINSSQIQYH